MTFFNTQTETPRRRRYVQSLITLTKLILLIIILRKLVPVKDIFLYLWKRQIAKKNNSFEINDLIKTTEMNNYDLQSSKKNHLKLPRQKFNPFLTNFPQM